jgi:hypothetical protein
VVEQQQLLLEITQEIMVTLQFFQQLQAQQEEVEQLDQHLQMQLKQEDLAVVVVMQFLVQLEILHL